MKSYGCLDFSAANQLYFIFFNKVFKKFWIKHLIIINFLPRPHTIEFQVPNAKWMRVVPCAETFINYVISYHITLWYLSSKIAFVVKIKWWTRLHTFGNTNWMNADWLKVIGIIAMSLLCHSIADWNCQPTISTYWWRGLEIGSQTKIFKWPIKHWTCQSKRGTPKQLYRINSMSCERKSCYVMLQKS